MSNDILDDLTDEEKALLKRDLKRRTQMQRNREESFSPLAGKIVVMGGISMMLLAVAMSGPIMGAGSSPIAPLLLITGGACVAVGLLMWFYFQKR